LRSRSSSSTSSTRRLSKTKTGAKAKAGCCYAGVSKLLFRQRDRKLKSKASETNTRQ
jgi:hypothetical protein